MQISRLFEIVYILLEKKQVTARQLAERFEVSVRTIFRDIDTLCEAGIPIYTNKGKGGGIRLMDNFILNKSVLSDKEQQEILTALQGLNATKGNDDSVLSRLNALFGREEPEWIAVDFGGWTDAMKNKFENLKRAVLDRKVVSFEYYNAKMEKSFRKVEPFQLYFRERTWYLKGYCQEKKQNRMFKLTRMKHIQILEEEAQHYKEAVLNEEQKHDKNIDIKKENRNCQKVHMKIDACMAYRVYDEFEEDQIIREDDGSFYVTTDYPEDNWLYGYILSYGPYLKVLQPESVAKVIQEQLRKALLRYGKSDQNEAAKG